MLRTTIETKLQELFGVEKINSHRDEWEIRVFDQTRNISKVGWAATLLPNIVDKARELNIDFIVTHHDAWPFLGEIRTESLQKLQTSNIGHLYVHGPLDEVDFGTAGSILKEIGCLHSSAEFNHDGINWGRIGELQTATSFDEIETKLNLLFSEEPKFKCVFKSDCKKIGVVTGGGNNSIYLKEAIDKGCDTYITGEYNCYFGMFAEANNLNSLVYSHTYTEKRAAKNLAERLFGKFADIEIIEIEEKHY